MSVFILLYFVETFTKMQTKNNNFQNSKIILDFS